MFWAKEKQPSKLDDAYDRALDVLAVSREGTEEYDKNLEEVIKLHRMRMEEKSDPVSKEAWLGIAANLLGILMILQYEKTNVVASKAMTILPKSKQV
jgi:hypothetical protein